MNDAMQTDPLQAQEQQPVLLLIDDSPSIHRLLGFKLKNEGLEFLTAYSGDEGLDLARTREPSLILLDLNMPIMDGFETLHALKESPETINIPIIVLSGSTDPEEKVKAFELGAMDFVCKPFDIHELRVRISSAIRISRLMRMLELRAQIDGLTGLWNRVHFNDRLTAEIDAAGRNGTELTLAICDLDHFKRLNDTFGHPAGDIVLQGFSSVLNTQLRSYDIACRYGGEEFAIILPEASIEQAHRVCDRIRATIAARRWPNYPNVRCTVSIGLTTHGVEGKNDPASWIQAADAALYAAKDAGRNQIQCYTDPEDPPKLALAS